MQNVRQFSGRPFMRPFGMALDFVPRCAENRVGPLPILLI
jgi:hypothetical protein